MKTTMKFVTIVAACLALGAPAVAQQAGPAPGETYSEAFRGSQKDNVEYQKIAPIKVFDNLYYVGPGYGGCPDSC